MPGPNTNRPERVGKLLQEEITRLLQRGDIKDPRVAMATISEVRVSKDLRNAKVYVQVIGTPAEREGTVKGLSNAAGFIRHQLKSAVSLRTVPELRFVADETAEKADRVLGLLADLERQRGKPAGAAPAKKTSKKTSAKAPAKGAASDESEE